MKKAMTFLGALVGGCVFLTSLWGGELPAAYRYAAVSWKGNFPSATRPSESRARFYFVPNGNEVAGDGSKVAIGPKAGVLIGRNANGGYAVDDKLLDEDVYDQSDDCAVVVLMCRVGRGRTVFTFGYDGDGCGTNALGVAVAEDACLQLVQNGRLLADNKTKVAGCADDGGFRFFGLSTRPASKSNHGADYRAVSLSFDGRTAFAGDRFVGTGHKFRFATVGACRGVPDSVNEGAECSAVFLFRHPMDSAELNAWTRSPTNEVVGGRHVELASSQDVTATTDVLSLEVVRAASVDGGIVLGIGAGAVLNVHGGLFANAPVTLKVDCAGRKPGERVVGGYVYNRGNVRCVLENAPRGMRLNYRDSYFVSSSGYFYEEGQDPSGTLIIAR